MEVNQRLFGTTPGGVEVTCIEIINAAGHSVELINYGATIVSVNVPDREGNVANVNLGFDNLQGYLQRHPYFGSTVGRVCNRIAGGHFEIDGKGYALAKNLGDHHLHGGLVAFDALLWRIDKIDPDAGTVGMSLESPDGDEGYPGNLTVSVLFSWNDRNELSYEFTATTDQSTHVNLTNHAYWNLAGAGGGKIYEHQTVIQSDQLLGVDDDLIPTGELVDVSGSALDFREPAALGERIDQLPETKGYDHCYALRGADGTLRLACRTVDPVSGRAMEIETTQPGMQLYTGNHLSGGEDAGGFGQHEAFCFETQHFPDAANQPNFKTTRLDPGGKLNEKTVHRFSIA